MLRNILTGILAFGLNASLYGAIVYNDQMPYESRERLASLYQQSLIIQDSLNLLNYKVVQMEIIEVKGKPYLLIDGRMNVFDFEDNVWHDISKSLYNGYNFFSKKFVLNNDIYSYGGYGFWRQHGDLIKFDWERREWETIPLEINHDIGIGVSFVIGDHLYVIRPQFKNQAVEIKDPDDKFYQINLKDGIVKSYPCSLIPSLGVPFLIETSGFLLAFDDPIYMIDKSNMSYKKAELSHMHALNTVEPTSFIVSRGDTVIFWRNDTIHEPVRYDLSEQYLKIDGEIKPLIAQVNFSSWFWLLLLVFPLTFLLLRKKRLTTTRPLSHPLFNKLLPYAGSTLDQDQLDRIFDIESIKTPETQRHKRSAIINKINQEYRTINGQDLIHRIPDAEDKRRFLYEIKSA